MFRLLGLQQFALVPRIPAIAPSEAVPADLQETPDEVTPEAELDNSGILA
jgi:hypothetical protein